MLKKREKGSIESKLFGKSIWEGSYEDDIIDIKRRK